MFKLQQKDIPKPFSWLETGLDRLGIFALLWAIGLVTHQFTFGFWVWAVNDISVLGWVVVLAALLVICYPKSTLLFITTVTLSLSYFYWQMPHLPNHIFYEWLTNFGLFLVFLTILFKSGLKLSNSDFRDNILKTFAPVARFSLLALYFWAVIHKLNWDYFNPENSCAVYLVNGYVWEFNKILAKLSLENHLFDYEYSAFTKIVAIAGSLFLEAIIPLLLLFRSTRLLGIGVGICFHFLLALHPHDGIYSFSALLIGAYFLFEPDRIWDAFNNRLQLLKEKYPKFIRFSPWLSLCMLALLVVVVSLEFQFPDKRIVFRSGFLLYMLLAISAFLFWLPLFRQHLFEGSEVKYKPIWGLMIIPLLIFANGWMPYLGLKTENSFSMFSNLRTEHTPNHLFIPGSLKVFDFQKNLVTVKSSNRRLFNNDGYHESEYRYYTAFEFRKRMRKFMLKDITFNAECEYQGESFSIEIKDGKSNQPEWVKPYPYWKLKLLSFRPIYFGPSLCQH